MIRVPHRRYRDGDLLIYIVYVGVYPCTHVFLNVLSQTSTSVPITAASITVIARPTARTNALRCFHPPSRFLRTLFLIVVPFSRLIQVVDVRIRLAVERDEESLLVFGRPEVSYVAFLKQSYLSLYLPHVTE